MTGSGFPPSAETLRNPEFQLPENQIVSSNAQLPPGPPAYASQISTGTPPRVETRLSFQLLKKPRVSPSGEKNGATAPSVPSMSLDSISSISRK